jgi:predicted metal-dependent hydrolase
MTQFDLPLFISTVSKIVPRLRAPEEEMRLAHLKAGPLPYRLVRRKRRTIALTVDHDGVTAAAPRWVSLGEIEKFIQIKESWLRKRLSEAVQRHPFEWRAGARLAWLGGEVTLYPDPAAKLPCLDGDKLRVALAADAPAEAWRETVLTWMRSEALALFRERAARMAPLLGVGVPPIKLSNSQSQWGSCSANGRILLCWRLTHLPLRLVDYVVAHELAHLIQLNHSKRFWALVEKLYPDYQTARKELNSLGRRLPAL